MEHKTHTQSPIKAGGLRPPVGPTTIVNSTNAICQGKHVPTIQTIKLIIKKNHKNKKIKKIQKFQLMLAAVVYT